MRWSDLNEALGSLPAWNDRIVIDGTNPVEFLGPDSPDAKDPANPLDAHGIKAIDLGGRSSSEVFRALVPGARVVKALNHLDVNVLAQPEACGGQRVQFYSGDDAHAKTQVCKVLEAIGPAGPAQRVKLLPSAAMRSSSGDSVKPGPMRSP
ncbi:hypothetical protein [Pseudorhodoferax soli]|uniref:Uncharacterized protein n=1 Tax=Pseudorhodoferax soli TaxID=545864 RepID=A0A368Y3T1_9BURK|nr:hypothetical protein DES41_102285 [Pseudorhodoferax soli]